MNETSKGSKRVTGSNPAIALITPCLLSAILFFTISFTADYVEAAPSTSPTDRGIHFQFDEATGELTIADGERDLTVPRKTAQEGTARPLRVWFRDPAMKVPLHGNDPRIEAVRKEYEKPYTSDDQAVLEESFDPEKRRLVNTYRWGKVIYQFEAEGERLDLDITVHNSSEKSIWKMDFSLFYFGLSRSSRPAEITESYFGPPARAYTAVATFEPVVLPLLDKEMAIVACSPEGERPLTLRWLPPKGYRKYREKVRHNDPNAQQWAETHEQAMKGKGIEASRSVFWQLMLTVGGDRLITHQRYTTRTIDPGESDTFCVSLRFGAEDRPLAPGKDITEAFARENPCIVDWQDRRPILRNFIGDKLPWHFPSGPEMEKPEGVEPSQDFQKYVFDSADAIIKDAESVDAQGVIVWNVEGPNHRWLGYLGDPRMVEYTCPEMDAVADEFFAKIRDAGLRTGVCLRPNEFFVRELPAEWKGFKEKHNTDTDWIYGHRCPREPGAVVDNLSAKVQYARQRWGCTIFYIDTNLVHWGPTGPQESGWPKWTSGRRKGRFINYRALMNAGQWRELKRRHPDCLFIPEHSNTLYYVATAPYDQINMNAGPTPPLVRATWPDAFKCLALEGRDVPRFYPDIVEIFQVRDVAMVNPGVHRYGQVYRDAAFEATVRDAPTPTAVAEMSREQLLDTAVNPDARRKSRYFAARRLLQNAKSQDRENVLESLLKSGDSLIVRMAMLEIGGPADVRLVQTLGRIWTDTWGQRNYAMRGFIIRAVSRVGPEAIPVLVEMERQTDRTQSFDEVYPRLQFTGEGLLLIGTSEAKAKLREFLEQETDRENPLAPYVRYLRRKVKKLNRQR
jgi:hypothetical protein